MASAMVLEGIRVVEISRWFACGIAMRLLAAFGAEVIKVESSTSVDSARASGGREARPDGKTGPNVNGLFNNTHSGKYGITLDLHHPRGVELAKRLIGRSDVLAENFPDDFLERMGLGYDEMRKVKPDLIYLSMPITGHLGPRRNVRGSGYHIAALAGLNWISRAGDEPPAGPSTAWSDWTIGPAHAAFAVLCALRHRRRTGQGQFIELSQYESTINITGAMIPEYTARGTVLGGHGNSAPDAVQGVFRCLGEDRWCTIRVATDNEWRALVEALHAPAWACDPAYATAAGRKEHEAALKGHLEEWLSAQEATAVVALLQEQGVEAGLVANIRDVLDDPQMQFRQHYTPLEHPEEGLQLYEAPPFKLARAPGRIPRPAPMLGEHNDYVLHQVLGLTEEEINEYIVSGAVA